MLIVMQAHATEEQVRAVCEKVQSLGLKPHPIPGASRTAIGITGNEGAVETGVFDDMAGVGEVIRVTKPYKLVSRDIKEENTIIRFPALDASVGRSLKQLALTACSGEEEDRGEEMPH